MTDVDQIRLALRRAAGRLGAVRFLAVSSGGYSVYCVGSSRDPENAYRVTVSPSGEYRCTCPSELRPACVHRAAVYLVRIQREAGGLPADGRRIGEAAVAPAPRRLPPRDEDAWLDAQDRAASARKLEEIAAQFA